MEALEFLEASAERDIPPVCVVYGDDPFLKRETLRALRQAVLGEGDGEYSFAVFSGDTAEYSRVMDELATLSLFGDGRRLAIVEDADDFVSEHRQALEEYVARPRSNGVLVLEVRTFAATTRLAKAVAASGLPVECKTPSENVIVKWLVKAATSRHQARLERPAAEQLLDLVGPSLGLLDQELAKLAASVKAPASIGVEQVQALVGGWRVRTTWDMIDLALEGKTGAALNQLDKVLLAGEEPIALYGQIGYSLRKMAAATRFVQQAEAAGRRPNLREALEAAGVRSFVMAKAEAQLRQIGRERGARLYGWLLEADLAMKGNRSRGDGPRLVLEQLFCRLAAVPGPAR
jgi:DNA polymerase-3 subunit delta